MQSRLRVRVVAWRRIVAVTVRGGGVVSGLINLGLSIVGRRWVSTVVTAEIRSYGRVHWRCMLKMGLSRSKFGRHWPPWQGKRLQ